MVRDCEIRASKPRKGYGNSASESNADITKSIKGDKPNNENSNGNSNEPNEEPNTEDEAKHPEKLTGEVTSSSSDGKNDRGKENKEGTVMPNKPRAIDKKMEEEKESVTYTLSEW